MKNKQCPVCGADIVCIVRKDDLYFYIEDEKVKQDTNPDIWAMTPFDYHCSDNYEHVILLDVEWCQEFEKEISKHNTGVK